MKKFLLNLLFLAVVTPLAAQTLILPGDYADPTILKDGDDYYMTHSPFYYQPGLRISRKLGIHITYISRPTILTGS